MQAMILAAGFGTRLRPYTLIRPKPLMPVLNTPLITRVLDQVRQSGACPIVVNGHHLADQVQASLACHTDVIFQKEKIILGTGGAIKKAQIHFGDGPVLISNADVFHTIDCAAVLRFHQQSGSPVTMVMHDFPRFNKVLVHGNKVISFDQEARTGHGRLLAFTGLHVIDSNVLRLIPGGTFYNIIDCYRALLAAGETVNAMVADQNDAFFWTDIGTKADYLALHERLLTGSPLAGEIMGNRPFLVAPDAVVADSVSFADWAVIGSKAVVGRGARICRSVLWDGVQVPPGAELVDTVVTC